MQGIRWGILGTGRIARQFAQGLTLLPGAELVAVGSRSMATADAFAEQFTARRRYASYRELAEDNDVDAVYVATPHSLHRVNSLLCLNRGKAVLCEKPFAISAAEAVEMIKAARENGSFQMEAMWTRFLPLMVELRALLDDGAIGEVRMLTADFGYRTAFDARSRIFDPALGGGALLDVGVYPVSLAHMVLGTPSRITALAHLGESGIDEQSAAVLGYENGQLAILTAAVRTETPHEACLMGSRGWIRIHRPWWRPTRMTITRGDAIVDEIERPFEGNGYNYEAAEVMSCLRAGQLESAIMPLEESLAVMRTLDEIRQQFGLRYPMESDSPRR